MQQNQRLILIFDCEHYVPTWISLKDTFAHYYDYQKHNSNICVILQGNNKTWIHQYIKKEKESQTI